MVLASVLKSLASSVGRRRTEARAAHRIEEALRVHESGDLEGGVRLLKSILSQAPNHAQAHYLAGLWYAQSGDNVRAQPHLEQAVFLLPQNADAQLALGNVCRGLGDLRRAEACYRDTIALAPGSAAGHYNLGLLLKTVGRTEEALAHLERACAMPPYLEDAWRERILALVACERYPEAIAAAREALDRDPRHGAFWSSLAYTQQKAHQPREALMSYERAQALGVQDHEFLNNRAIVYQELGRMDEAVAGYEQALARKPDFVLARFHLALARLAMRQYGRAWDDYELRLLSEDSPRRARQRPAWEGEPLGGRSIAIIGEQGLGDEIMFASCFDEVVNAAARATIACAPRLEKLFRRSFPAAVVKGMEPGSSLALHDVDCEVMAGTLPRFLRRSAADFPLQTGYLQADHERVAYWQARLARLGPALKVGISWRGGTHKTRAPLRTLPLSAWTPILGTPGVRFVSLQYGDTREDLRASPGIVHWPEAIDDYDETAALVCALDLVISVCTAVIHLAGALGRPVWVMAPVSPEWRYAVAGDKMDWYPSSRMFRQHEFGSWSPVVASVADALRSAELPAESMKTP